MTSAFPMLATEEDVEEYEKIPYFQRYPETFGYRLFIRAGERFGDDPALQFLLTAEENEAPEVVSFRDLSRRIVQTANALCRLGAGRGDSIAMLLPNVLQTWYAVWGAQAVAISNPINPLLEARLVVEIMNATRAKMLIALAPVQGAPAYWEKINTIVNRVPSLETLLLVRVEGYTGDARGPLERELNVVDFNTAIAAETGATLVGGEDNDKDAVAAYFHTGGTTGRPKIACITHANIAFVGQLVVDISAYRGRYTALSALPLFHIYGLISAGIGAIAAGRCLVLMTPAGFRSPKVISNWWHHAARFRVAGFSAVPTVLAALLNVPTGANDLSGLTDVGSGAAPLPKPLKQEFQRRFGIRVTDGYGMTESTCLICRALPERPAPDASVGVRIPYTEVRIVILDGNKVLGVCRPNETGTLLIRGPHVFKGYLDEGDNAGAWIDGDWFNTGDLAFMDAQGYVTLTGRVKDLIIRGGHNIDPGLIEEPLAWHPAVAEVAAIGQPDPYAGELPVAYVRLKPEFIGKTGADELLSYCQTEISEKAAIPKRIEILDKMPVTAVGKLFKPALCNSAAEYALTQCLQVANITAEVRASFDPGRGRVATVKLGAARDHTEALRLLSQYPVIIEFA
jgi:fatty-acyl-CoA synthase